MVTRVVPVGKKKVLIPANIRNCKSLRGFSMIDYFNCATDFADHADKFFFPDPKWLKTIIFFSADSAQFSTKSAVKSSKLDLPLSAPFAARLK